MIGIGQNGCVQISTGQGVESYDYLLRATVRLIGLAHAGDLEKEDCEMIRSVCGLLEDMLPGEGQIIVLSHKGENPTAQPSPKERAYAA